VRMDLSELLIYIIPSVVVFLTTVTTLFLFFRNEQNKRKYELAKQNSKVNLPFLLQAHERATIFCERIGLDSLVKRNSRQGQTVAELQSKLLMTIRTEFEHNFSQQLYLSDIAWVHIVSAKENMIKLINTEAIKLKPEQPGIFLAKALIEVYADIEFPSNKKAIQRLRDDVRSYI